MLFLAVSNSSSFTTLPRAIKSLRSMPAQKAFPLPERIITRQSGSFPNRLNASPISLKKKINKEDKIFANSRRKAFNVLVLKKKINNEHKIFANSMYWVKILIVV